MVYMTVKVHRCLYASGINIVPFGHLGTDTLLYFHLYEATLKILDKNKQPDIRFPEVPKVKTDIPVLKNEIVAIVLMYGECKPYIIGRCF